MLVVLIKMARKTCARRNINESAKKDLKQKWLEVEDDIDETIHVEDEDEGSQSYSITDGAAVQGQSSRISLVFTTPEFELRYRELNMSTRIFLFGNPRNHSILDICDLTVLLNKFGISLLPNLSRFCYPSYVVEFYANLHKDILDNYISIVTDVYWFWMLLCYIVSCDLISTMNK